MFWCCIFYLFLNEWAILVHICEAIQKKIISERTPKWVLKTCFYPWSPKVEPWVNRWTFFPPPPSSPPSSHHQIFVSLRYRKCCGGGGREMGAFAVSTMQSCLSKLVEPGARTLSAGLWDLCPYHLCHRWHSEIMLKLEPNEESCTKH